MEHLLPQIAGAQWSMPGDWTALAGKIGLAGAGRLVELGSVMAGLAPVGNFLHLAGFRLLSVLRGLALCAILASAMLYLLQCLAGAGFARRARRRPPAAEELEVALLKPLHGFSPGQLAAVSSFLDIDYGRRRLVLGLTDKDDPARRIVEELHRRSATVPIEVVVGEEPATNRKVGKLMRLAASAGGAPILVMSDADVMVERDYLRRIVAELAADPSVGMVTCLYRGLPFSDRLAARLEALFVNTDFAPMAMLSYYIEPMRHAYASTIAAKREALEAAGGLAAVKDSYGDDILLARRAARAGYEIRLSSAAVTTLTEQESFADFWAQQVRGARVDRRIRPISLGRILVNGPFWALVLLALSRLSAEACWLFAAAVGLRMAMAAFTLRIALRLPTGLLKDLWLVPIKDLIMAAVWAVGLTGNTVEWRGRRLMLLGGGKYALAVGPAGGPTRSDGAPVTVDS